MATCQDLFENENGGNEELEGLLFQSCRDGHMDVVDRLLSKGVRPDVRDKDGRSPLVVSSVSGWEDIVTLILDQGVDVRKADGATALVEACKNGHWKVVKTLAERGIDLNERDRDGKTVLNLACMKGHDKVVEILIEHNVSCVNDRDDCGRTPLMCACERGHVNVVEILIKHLCDVDTKTDFDTTALMEACKNGHDKVVEILLEHVSNVDEKNDDGMTALFLACRNKDDKVSRLLIEHGARVDVRDENGKTLLIAACEALNILTVELLIEEGLDVNAGNNDGITPLMAVCWGIESDEWSSKQRDDIAARIIRLLIEHGAEVDTQDLARGWSAIMTAVLIGNTTCLRALLTHGPNLDLVDRLRCTVFTHAMESVNLESLRILLEDGNLMEGGKLKRVHKYPMDAVRDSLLLTIEFGVFEWKWSSIYFLEPVTLAAIQYGLSPGKMRCNINTYSSPLVMSVLENKTELTKTILDRLYYYPEDYRTLCTDTDVRGRVKNRDILDKITLQPLSLQTWCCLNVSKAISTTCFPFKRRDRVDTLPIPDKVKRRLNFE